MKRTAHFKPELFQFLHQLDRNNNREWFARNRDRYVEIVRDPMLRFIADFGPHLRKVSPEFIADPRPQGGSMFRVHRDIRFAADKRPYKTHAAAQFRHERGKDVHAPGFYLHLEPKSVFAAAGVWQPDSATLLRLRQGIVARPAEWKRAVTGKAFRAVAELDGDVLARPPKGFDRDHPLMEYLRRKDFVAVVDFDEEAACAPDFVERYAGACRAMAPLVKFLATALDLKF